MNKKGTIQDVILIAVVLFVFALTTLIVFKVSNTLNTEFQASSVITSNGKTAFSTINNMYPGVIDNMFLLLTIGLGVVAIILSSLIRQNPVFFVFFILVMAILIFITAIFSNVYLTIANNSNFTTEAEALTFTTHTIWLLPFIIGILGFVLALIQYKNWRDT